MSSPHLEIEIKSLLGSAEKAAALKSNLEKKFPGLKLSEQSQQLNHYFLSGDLSKLTTSLLPHLPADKQSTLKTIIEKGKNASVRTRLLKENGTEKVIFVIKASIDDTTSSNGISRMEFEAEMKDVTLDQLDQLLLDSGLTYQAKWSRQREAYTLDDTTTVAIDKNAGYGYLAEFEAVVGSDENIDVVQTRLRDLMKEVGAEELAQDRLERMFAHYNQNWAEYYGTEKTFVVE